MLSKENTNLILMTDSYKHTHWSLYPKGTSHVYSYFESRGGKYDKTVFFGLQMLLRRYLEGSVVTKDDVLEAAEVLGRHFGQNYFNLSGWLKVVNKYRGRIPVQIRAVDEGTVVPTHNVLMTIVNTDPELPFLTNFLETLLVQTWYPITVCTQSWHIKQMIKAHCERTGVAFSPFMLHDFGFRGTSSVESAGIGGAAHLVNFWGTDTLNGLMYANKYYGAGAEPLHAYSVMASEHSTVTAYGKEHEADAYKRFLSVAPDDAIISIVSDSYDIDNAVKEIYGKTLKDQIVARAGKLVVRPDSGDPVEVSTRVMKELWIAFGGTVNKAGYRELDPHVGMIYGDGICYETIDDILTSLETEGFAASNIVFGMGGALLQQVNRDTQKFAFKCSATKCNGKWRNVFKQPRTDSGKNSKAGMLALYRPLSSLRSEDFQTVTLNTESGTPQFNERFDQLHLVFTDGDLTSYQPFDRIRERSEQA